MSSKTDKKKAMVPKLRFPEFRNARPWEVKRLGEVADRITEKVGSLKLVPVSISARKGFVTQKEKFGRDISGRQYKNYIRLKKGQFAYNKGNSKVFPQGAVYQLREFDEAAVPNAFYSFEFQVNYVSEFFTGYFENNFHGRQLAKFITSSARSDGLLNISADDFFSIILPVPSDRKEQQKIADCLSSLDEVIDLEAKRLEALKAHKKGLMQQLFPAEGETTPRLRFPEFRDAGPWEVKRLGEVIELAYGAALPESRRRVGTIPVLGSNGVVGYHNEPLTRGPTIVIGRKGSAGEVVWMGEDCFPIDTTFYVQFRSPRDDPRFVYFLLVMLNLPELARAEGVPGLNRNDVYSIKVGIPRSEEQQKIAACLSSLDEVIELQTKKLEALKAHKKGLMQQLFPSDGL